MKSWHKSEVKVQRVSEMMKRSMQLQHIKNGEAAMFSLSVCLVAHFFRSSFLVKYPASLLVGWIKVAI